MSLPALPKLATASIAANFADQMTLALVPLMLTAVGTDARTISFAVAAQSAAWLLVSLPVGAYSDAISRRRVMCWGAVAIMSGAAMGEGVLAAGFDIAKAAALPVFIIATGVVMLVLSVFALLPRSVSATRLATANAGLEFGRAVASTIAPLLAAYVVKRGQTDVGYALAFLAGLVALAAAWSMPVEEPRAGARVSLIESIRDGAAFVMQQPILRAIAGCAIAWNLAFFALMAVFAPWAKTQLGMSLEAIGNAQSVYGLGLLVGALAASPMIARLPTAVMFVFGPAVSCGAVMIMLLSAHKDATWPVSVAFFALGFGPMTWLVLQTSVRQIVTPAALLGRVGATITTAIYGVRPLGALAAGQLSATSGTGAALWFAAILFIVSCVFLLLSPAARLRAMPSAA